MQYGNEEYKFAIFYQLQFCKQQVIDFIKRLDSSNTGYIIIGAADTDFNGQLLKIKNNFDYRINAIDLLPYYNQYSVNKNRIPNGCYMQDGSLILTPACHNKIIENDFEASFEHEEKTYKISAQDYAYIKFEANKEPIVISPKLNRFKIIDD